VLLVPWSLFGGGSTLAAGFKRLLELGGCGWLCGAQRCSLVCLGTVRPFVYAGGTRVSWRRFAARGLFNHAPNAGGVVVLCGLGCTLPTDYVNGTRVQWRRFAVRGLFDHTPDVGGVMALYGLGCVLLSWRCVVLAAHFRHTMLMARGCSGVVSLCVASTTPPM
jgi:hypothetical protein